MEAEVQFHIDARAADLVRPALPPTRQDGRPGSNLAVSPPTKMECAAPSVSLVGRSLDRPPLRQSHPGKEPWLYRNRSHLVCTRHRCQYHHLLVCQSNALCPTRGPTSRAASCLQAIGRRSSNPRPPRNPRSHPPCRRSKLWAWPISST
jgi:hypothetical protein